MMEELVPATRVILWTSPRSLSNAFERSIRELSEVKVLHEPHMRASLMGPERILNAYNDIMLPDTYNSADETLLARYEDYSAIFAKDMARYIPRERFLTYIEGRFETFKHTFLIRTPQKTALSMWRVCSEDNLPYCNSDFNMLSELHELFQLLQSRGKVSAVVDADDLQKDPEKVMQHYCAATGLKYDEKMLTWSPGMVEDWAIPMSTSRTWDRNAMFSSGFNVGLKAPALREESYPLAVEEQILKEMPHYEAMYKYRTVSS